MTYCLNCNSELTGNHKYCSSSCAAIVNNRLYPKRTAAPAPSCAYCGKTTKSNRNKYCDAKCFNLGRRKNYTEAELRAKNVSGVQAYRQRKYSATPIDADRKLILEFYKNCPEGYEVDHIIPISKGGKHHQDNLQYLTAQENRRKSNKIIPE